MLQVELIQASVLGLWCNKDYMRDALAYNVMLASIVRQSVYNSY